MKVLQLVSYPIKQPRHGGQIRVSQIAQWLARENMTVKTVSISEPSHDAFGVNDLVLDLGAMDQPHGMPFCTDLLTSLISGQSGRVYDYLLSQVAQFSPDFIFLEQPWLWPAVRRMVDQGVVDRSRTTIVYSSQNVEYLTKHSILSELCLDADQVRLVKNDIRMLETSLCESADWVVAVTEGDSECFRKLGARNVVVCPNGVAERTPDPSIVAEVKQIFYGRRYLIYVGSAYPPNAAGFWQLMGPSLAAFNPDEAIALVGGLSDIVDHYASDKSYMTSSVNGHVLMKFGKVSEPVLEALISGASGFILPIMSGGGSNLKTAEAIVSGLPIVASPIAMRGYEHLSSLSRLYVESSPESFQSSALRILREPQRTRFETDSRDAQMRSSVYWKNTLSKLREVVDR